MLILDAGTHTHVVRLTWNQIRQRRRLGESRHRHLVSIRRGECESWRRVVLDVVGLYHIVLQVDWRCPRHGQ